MNFLYGNDNAHLGDNQNFYKKGGNQQKKGILYPELSNEYDVSDVNFDEVVDIRQTVNYEAKRQYAEKKKEME